MMTLGLELSSSARSVALWVDGTGETPTVVRSAPNEDPRATRAFELIEKALQLRGATSRDVTHIVLGLGPGSYTGIRAAISIAQGWSAGRGVKLLGIPATEILAWQASQQAWQESLSLAFDAQRGEAYAARYERSGGVYVETEPLKLIDVALLRSRMQAGERVAGPDLSRLLPEATPLLPDAGTLAALSAGRTGFVSGEALEPVYLRETSFVKVKPVTH